MKDVTDTLLTQGVQLFSDAFDKLLKAVDRGLARATKRWNRRLRAVPGRAAEPEFTYAITVCALFNFYNRWIDASGVHPMSNEAHRQGARRSASAGYVRR